MDCDAAGRVARARFRSKDYAGGRKAVQEIIRDAPRQTSRSFDQVALILALHGALSESVAAGQWSDAWDLQGQWLDLPSTSFGGQFLVSDFDRMIAELATRPAAARYDFLKNWVLPSGERKALRLASSMDFVENRTPDGAPHLRWPTSTFGLLIEAGRAAGQLDALAAAVGPLVEQKVAHAETFALLIDISRGRVDATAPRVRRRADELAQKAGLVRDALQSSSGFRTYNEIPTLTDQISDALLAVVCLADPNLRDLGLALADQLIMLQEQLPTLPWLSSVLRREAASVRVSRSVGVARMVAGELGLALWRPDAAPEAGDPASGWVEHEGHLQLIPGSIATSLRFVYPLAGSFEFAFEATGSGHAGFGGRSFPRPEPAGSRVRLSPWSQKAEPDDGSFHRHRLYVGPNKLHCWIDGRLVHESDDFGRAHPWLTLSADDSTGRPSVFRNLTLTGSPDVPAQSRCWRQRRFVGTPRRRSRSVRTSIWPIRIDSLPMTMTPRFTTPLLPVPRRRVRLGR